MVNVATVPPAAATVCATQWGSLQKLRGPSMTRHVVNVRSGRHRCFDRLVIDLDGAGTGGTGYQVRYVRRVREDGSGAVIPLRGRASVQITVHAPACDGEGAATYQPANRRELVDVAGYQTFRQVAWAGTFEGETTIGLGVRARLPMRVLVLKDPGGGRRVVVDVAHRWS
jgi:hypothetical protein